MATRILALDASTTTIGISILDYDGYHTVLTHHEFYKPDKANGIIHMLKAARAYILDLIDVFKVDEVVIEEYTKFMKGRSSAATIIPLAILNTTIQLSISDKFGITVVPLNVLKIRHAIKKDKILPKKEEIPELVAEILGIDFPWVERKGKIRIENYDVADSIAVALAYIKLQQSSPKKHKRSKKRR
jgi:Holliday junction resolvasome RuvABC endonuclease subunit